MGLAPGDTASRWSGLRFVWAWFRFRADERWLWRFSFFFSPGESQVHGLLQEIEKTASAVGQIPLSSKFGDPFGSWSRHKTKNETFLSPPDPFLIRRLPFPLSLVLAWQRRSFQLC